MSGNAGLGDNLIALTELVADSVPPEQTLLRVAEFAAEMSPQACGAVVSELEGDSPRTTVATSALAKCAHEAQFEVGEGPCLAAIARRAVVLCNSLGNEPEWQRYAGRVRRLGLQSALVTPLLLQDRVVAVLAIYATRKGAFTVSDASIAERYARPVAAIVRNARVLAQCRTELQQLHEALRVRPVIDQAVGILRGRTGESGAEAFERLRAVSNAEHIKISELAARIIDDAVHKAVSRRHVG